MGLFDKMLNSATNAVGNAVGNAAGTVLNQVAGSVADSVKNDIKINDEKKRMELAEQKKAMSLPPICPHCGARTVGKLICDYCDCKIVE